MSRYKKILAIVCIIGVILLTYLGRGERYLNILAQLIFIALLCLTGYYIFLDIWKSLPRYRQSLRDYRSRLLAYAAAVSNDIHFSKFLDSKLKAVLLLTGISALIYHKWLSFSIFISGDYHWITAGSLAYLRPLSAWRAFVNTGEPNWVLWSGYTTSLFGFFGSLGLNSNVVMNALVLWFLVLVAPVISFFFVKQFTGKSLTAFVFSLLLLFNVYVLTNTVVGHLLLSVAFYFSLAAFTFYAAFIKSELKNTPALVLSAILLWVTGLVDFRIFYLVVFCFITFQLLYLLLKKLRIAIWYFIGRNAVFFLILALLNMYWLFPTMVIKGTNDILTRTLFGKGLMDLFNAWSGTYYYWSLTNKIVWGYDTGFPFIFMLLPLSVILVLYFAKKRSVTLIFTILFIIGAFFGKQNTAPFARVYEFLFQYFPGFSAFRDATKMFQITIMAIPIILATGYENIDSVIVKRILLGSTLLIVTLNIYSLVRFQNHLLTPTSIPDYYQDVLSLESGEYDRILWVPRNETVRTGTASNPRLSLDEMRYGTWSHLLDRYDAPLKMSEILENYNLRALLTMNSIRYLFVPKQLQTVDTEINDDAFYYDDNRDQIVGMLRSYPWLSEKQINSKDASLFEMTTVRPHIYLTKERENFSNMFDLEAIEVANDYVNSSVYKLYLKNLPETSYLTFTDTFSQQWLLGPTFDSNLAFALSNDPVTPSGFRSKNQAGGNVFTINQDYIQSIAPDYEQNEDGTINAVVTMYYSPQKKLIIGNYISIATLFVLSIYLSVIAVKKYRRRTKK